MEQQQLISFGIVLLVAAAGFMVGKKSETKARSSIFETNKLHALERIVLMLERVSIPNLVVREAPVGNTASFYQQHLIQTVRKEFNHNLSQQIYISHDVWVMVAGTIEATVKYINETAAQYSQNASDNDLARTLLTTLGEASLMNQHVIEALKKEI